MNPPIPRRQFLTSLAAAPIALATVPLMGRDTPSAPPVVAAPRVSVPLRWRLWGSVSHGYCGPVSVGHYYASYHRLGTWGWHCGNSCEPDYQDGYTATEAEARAAVQSVWDQLLGATPSEVQPVGRPVVETKALEWQSHIGLSERYWNAYHSGARIATVYDRPNGQVAVLFDYTIMPPSYRGTSVIHPTFEAAQAAVQQHWSAFVKGAIQS